MLCIKMNESLKNHENDLIAYFEQKCGKVRLTWLRLFIIFDYLRNLKKIIKIIFLQSKEDKIVLFRRYKLRRFATNRADIHIVY